MRITSSATPLLLGCACLCAGARADAATVVDAKVPFAFTVGDQTLPPGEYRVEQEGQDADLLVIRSDHGRRVAIVTSSIPASGHDPAGAKGALVFTRDERGYRLKDVWEDHDDGREIPAR